MEICYDYVVALMAIAGSLFVWNVVTTINEVLEYFEHCCKSLVFPTGFAVTRVWTMFKFRDIWSQSGGSFVADRRIHNQQIARLWTEVNRVGSALHGDLFHSVSWEQCCVNFTRLSALLGFAICIFTYEQWFTWWIHRPVESSWYRGIQSSIAFCPVVFSNAYNNGWVKSHKLADVWYWLWQSHRH